MHFVQVIPDHDDWERLNTGIERVNKHSAVHLRQTFAEVQDALDKGQCAWFCVRDGQTILSDLIVKTLIEETRRTLYVWLMFGSRLDKWARFAMDALNDLAIFNRCDRVKFHTTRDKWIHLISDVPGEWEQTHVFTRKVSYERQR